MSIGQDRYEASEVEAPQAAARLLELAARNADQLLDEAKTEAASIVATAHAEADDVLSELAERRTDLEAELFRLQELEQEHRDRMRGHLTQMLEQLEPNDV